MNAGTLSKPALSVGNATNQKQSKVPGAAGEHLHVQVYVVWQGGACAVRCCPASWQPLWQSKVDSLCAVEAQIEATVIGASVENDELASLLLCLQLGDMIRARSTEKTRAW